MNSRLFDWKFFTGLLCTIAGVLVPVWLWQADQVAKALRLQVISVTALNPQSALPVAGLKLTLDGQDVSSPYLSVVEISNTGSRPLLQADFETDIEISGQNAAKAIRAEFASAQPTDLKPMIKTTEGKVLLQPLLLNPGDQIRIAVLTTGEKPQLAVRSRIAGVSKVEFVDKTDPARTGRKLWINAVVGFFLLVIYMAAVARCVGDVRTRSFHPTTAIAAFICCLGGIFLFQPLQEAYALTKLQFLFVLGAAGVVASPLMWRHMRPKTSSF